MTKSIEQRLATSPATARMPPPGRARRTPLVIAENLTATLGTGGRKALFGIRETEASRRCVADWTSVMRDASCSLDLLRSVLGHAVPAPARWSQAPPGVEHPVRTAGPRRPSMIR